MGYLVEWHIPKEKFNFDILDSLPSNLPANVFKIGECKYNLIYADFGLRKIFPQSFYDKYDALNKLYSSLTKADVEISLNPQVVNLNLWLSNALNDEVISVESDDDQLDLAVQSKLGTLTRLRFRAEDVEVLFQNNEIHIFPLITEDEEPIVDLDCFEKELFILHPREKEHTCELHGIASEEIASFLSIEPQIIGLATWDFDEKNLEKVFCRKSDEEKSIPEKPWWRFWS